MCKFLCELALPVFSILKVTYPILYYAFNLNINEENCMDILSNILAVAVVSWLGALSPGPDFFIVVRNSLSYSRKIGFYTTFGVCLGLLIHLFYTLIGIGVLIAESALIYNMIKYAGAIYLFYLGVSGVLASFKKKGEKNYASYAVSSSLISRWTAVKQGFLTNALNPKAALFFISLFSQFIAVTTPLSLKIAYAATNWIVGLTWFLFVSYVVTNPLFIQRINQFQLYIDRVFGLALIGLSIKIILI